MSNYSERFYVDKAFKELFYQNSKLNVYGKDMNKRLAYLGNIFQDIMMAKSPSSLRRRADGFFVPNFYDDSIENINYTLNYNFGTNNPIRYEMGLFHSHILYLMNHSADESIIVDYILNWFAEMKHFTTKSRYRKVLGISMIVTEDRKTQKKMFETRMIESGIPRKYWHRSKFIN